MAAGDLFDDTEDATPLDAEERDGLIPTHITLRSELNALEERGIATAEFYAFGRRRHNPISETFGVGLHKRMFGGVWKWAGAYRSTNKNIGVDRHLIHPSLYKCYDDTSFFVKEEVYAPDEIAARFHQGLVYIHPFANGNGRWSRVMADVLLVWLGQPRFTAARGDVADAELRRAYVAALRQADAHDFEALISFLRP